MKKSTIWILGIVMGLSFLSLLYLQVSYIEEMVKMRREQFDESVRRSLDQACRNIELVETKKYLEDDVVATERAAQLYRQQAAKEGKEENELVAHTQHYAVSSDGLDGYSTFELKMKISTNRPANVPKAIISTGKNIPQTARALQEIIKERYDNSPYLVVTNDGKHCWTKWFILFCAQPVINRLKSVLTLSSWICL